VILVEHGSALRHTIEHGRQDRVGRFLGHLGRSRYGGGGDERRPAIRQLAGHARNLKPDLTRSNAP
jgi:hypothetical protein